MGANELAALWEARAESPNKDLPRRFPERDQRIHAPDSGIATHPKPNAQPSKASVSHVHPTGSAQKPEEPGAVSGTVKPASSKRRPRSPQTIVVDATSEENAVVASPVPRSAVPEAADLPSNVKDAGRRRTDGATLDEEASTANTSEAHLAPTPPTVPMQPPRLRFVPLLSTAASTTSRADIEAFAESDPARGSSNEHGHRRLGERLDHEPRSAPLPGALPYRLAPRSSTQSSTSSPHQRRISADKPPVAPPRVAPVAVQYVDDDDVEHGGDVGLAGDARGASSAAGQVRPGSARRPVIPGLSARTSQRGSPVATPGSADSAGNEAQAPPALSLGAGPSCSRGRDASSSRDTMSHGLPRTQALDSEQSMADEVALLERRLFQMDAEIAALRDKLEQQARLVAEL